MSGLGSFGMARPPTGSHRPKTGFTATGLPPGTASGRNNRGGAGGRSATMEVDSQAMVNQGMMRVPGTRAGSRYANRGGGDKNSVVGDLSARVEMVQAEVDRLTEERNRREDEIANYAQYEARAESLNNDLVKLQGTLADYNLLVEKMHTDTDLDDIVRQTMDLRDKNEAERQRVDRLFKERASKEQATAELEDEIESIKKHTERELASVDPELLRAYREAERENDEYVKRIPALQQEMDGVSAKVSALEKQVRQDPGKQRAHAMENQIRELKLRKDEMILEEEQAQLTGPEEKERLRAAMKADKQEVSVMQRRIEELGDVNARMRDTLESMEKEQREMKSEKYQVYLQIVAKDKEIQNYIESFPAKKEKIESHIADSEHTIVALLEAISHNLERRENLPSVDDVASNRETLERRARQASDNEKTVERLKADRQATLENLRKVKVLHKKVHRELEDLEVRVPQMREELIVFSDLDKLRRDAEETKQELLIVRENLQRRRDGLSQLVRDEKAAVAKLEEDLNKNEVHSMLKNLEGKLTQYTEMVAQAEEFIKSKGRESDYVSRVAKVQEELNALNTLVIDLTRAGPSRSL